MMAMMKDKDGSDSDSDVAFAPMDFTGVDFDNDESNYLTEMDKNALSLEPLVLFSEYDDIDGIADVNERIRNLYNLLSTGEYKKALSSSTADKFFSGIEATKGNDEQTMATLIRARVYEYATDVSSCMEVQLLAVAALNLFLQLNYTGPSLLDMSNTPSSKDDDTTDPLAGIHPHSCFQSFCQDEGERNETSLPLTTPKRDNVFHNNVLSELADDGEWPCHVCQAPYLLLLARSMFSALSNQQGWSGDSELSAPASFANISSHSESVHLWNARATVAHARLLQTTGEPPQTLWEETSKSFQSALHYYCESVDTDATNDNWKERCRAATVVLEWGLAHHYFGRPSKLYFSKATEYSGLQVELTGAVGKRTKFQQDSKAQMIVRATSAIQQESSCNDTIEATVQHAPAVQHGEDGIMLEKIKFDDEKENQVSHLTTLDQSTLLALCLDVKNNNPADGLTGEEMGAYLARVLDQHDDWMIYSTALLERAWLEYERTQGRARAILQIQALVDQHSNRLSITQSTFESIQEQSAPPQERLRNLHSIVYPPRWAMLRDLAERYASLGVVTTAAEMFAEIELWDQVVECYRHAGKASQAEDIVRERLEQAETPRMWAALGDLTNDPSCYERALEVSKGRYSDAYVALGKYYFDKGDMERAADFYSKALKIRPLMPHVWFRLGTISMQLGRWKEALNSFSEVVQQEPEEADAWANVAAVHMHNRMPAEAYPALNESLKHRRNNWRVWTSKLYTCIDLQKYDEAVQACNVLLDLKSTKNMGESIPPLEERCVRAIVGGSIEQYRNARDDKPALDSARRTLTRVHDLLERLSCSSTTEAWIWETLSFFNSQIGRDEAVLDNLMKEYRSLQAIAGWEKDPSQVKKASQVVKQIVQFHLEDGTKESLAKSRLLLSGVVRKIRSVHMDESQFPGEVTSLVQLQEEVSEQLKAVQVP